MVLYHCPPPQVSHLEGWMHNTLHPPRSHQRGRVLCAPRAGWQRTLLTLCASISMTLAFALSRRFHAGPIPVGKMPSLLPLCPNFDSGAEKPLADAGHAAVGSLPWSFHGNRRDEGGRISPFNCVHDSLATTTSRARASADEHAPVAPVTRIRAGRAGGARTQKDERNAAGCSCVLI